MWVLTMALVEKPLPLVDYFEVEASEDERITGGRLRKGAYMY
jgi:hypothetical protein